METVTDFIFLGSKITADSNYSHKIKGLLLLGRKAMTNLASMLKSRDITLPTKVYIIKAMVFPMVMYGCESWTIKFSSVHLLSHVWLFVTPWTVAHQTSLSIINSWSYPNPSSLSWWCHPTISSSVIPFSSCPQSFPASGSFQMSQLFASGDQSIGVSASISVLPMNTQD